MIDKNNNPELETYTPVSTVEKHYFHDEANTKHSHRFIFIAGILLLLMGTIIFAKSNNITSLAGSLDTPDNAPPTNLTIISHSKDEVDLEWTPSPSVFMNKYAIYQLDSNNKSKVIAKTTKSSFIYKATGAGSSNYHYQVLSYADYAEVDPNWDNTYHINYSAISNTAKPTADNAVIYSNDKFNDIGTDKSNQVLTSADSAGYNVYNSTGSFNELQGSYTIPNINPTDCKKVGQGIEIYLGLKSFLNTSQSSSDGSSLAISCVKVKDEFKLKYQLFLDNIPVSWSNIPIAYGSDSDAKLLPGTNIGLDIKVSNSGNGNNIEYHYTIQDSSTTTRFNISLPCSNEKCYYNGVGAELINDSLCTQDGNGCSYEKNPNLLNYNQISFKGLKYGENNNSKLVDMVSDAKQGDKPTNSIDKIYYRWDELQNGICSTASFAAPDLGISMNKKLQDNFGSNGASNGVYQDITAIDGQDTNFDGREVTGNSTATNYKILEKDNLLNKKDNLLNKNALNNGVVNIYYNKSSDSALVYELRTLRPKGAPSSNYVISDKGSYCYKEPQSFADNLNVVLNISGLALALATAQPEGVFWWAANMGVSDLATSLGSSEVYSAYQYQLNLNPKTLTVYSGDPSGGANLKTVKFDVNSVTKMKKEVTAVRKAYTVAKFGEYGISGLKNIKLLDAIKLTRTSTSIGLEVIELIPK